MLIYHLSTVSDWERAKAAGTYETSTRGLTIGEVGFIHASTAEQVVGVAEMFYLDCEEELVLLVIDVDALAAAGIPVRFEEIEDGQVFPHIYAPLPSDLVVEVRPASFDENDRFVMPPALG